MATYLHFAPAVALAAALGTRTVGWRLILAGAVCGVMPDLDFLSVALRFDHFSGTYGHRGFTHSLGFALLVGLLGALWPSGRGIGWRPRVGRGTFLALCTVSHPLLDSLIDVHICSAWLWPLDGARHCLDWRPIPMQGVPLFGAERLRMELLWIGVPLLVLANVGMLVRHTWRRWVAWQSGAQVAPSPAWPPTASGGQGPRARRRLRNEAMQAVGRAWMGRAIRAGVNPAAARWST